MNGLLDVVSYQLPPLITKKTAVVISPLISLMQDQVRTCEEFFFALKTSSMDLSGMVSSGRFSVKDEKYCSHKFCYKFSTPYITCQWLPIGF